MCYGESEYEVECAIEEFKDSLIVEKGHVRAISKVEFDLSIFQEEINNKIERMILGKFNKILDAKIEKEVRKWFNVRDEFIDSSIKGFTERRLTEFFDKVDKTQAYAKIEEYLNKYNVANSLTIDKWFKNAVNEKINRELDEVIAATKTEIKDYAQNYFSRNLFKAMNLMDNLLERK